jgi:D-glycero-D-manno-heptose 1,7-bisphosphate phosphatase
VGRQAAIFLDRDGVIAENRANYIRNLAEVKIFPQALEALARLNETAYKVVIVTNQSAVGRGFISLETAGEINQLILREITKAGGRVDGIYICPHAPWDECACRKPKPGLLLQAADELQIDLSRSLMIGDALSDLQAGRAAGVKELILVRTGRGEVQMQLPEAADLQPFEVFDTLLDTIIQRI